VNKDQVIASVSRSEMELRGLGELARITRPRRFQFDALEIIVSERGELEEGVYLGVVEVVFSRAGTRHEWLLPAAMDPSCGEWFLQFYEYFLAQEPLDVLRAVWCLRCALGLDVLVLTHDHLRIGARGDKALNRDDVWFGCSRDVAWASGFDSVLTADAGVLFL
jgi:hypothetical protein